jgi:hypothetical protein
MGRLLMIPARTPHRKSRQDIVSVTSTQRISSRPACENAFIYFRQSFRKDSKVVQDRDHRRAIEPISSIITL